MASDEQKSYQHVDISNNETKIAPLTAAFLGSWIANENKRRDPEILKNREFLTRALIHSVLGIPAERLSARVAEPANTGDSRWDALLQGLVAWRCQTADPPVATPSWARKTRLDEAWAPFGGSIRDDGWYTLSVLATPVALLHRGVVLDRLNLKEL